jgi:rubrerythrin
VPPTDSRIETVKKNLKELINNETQNRSDTMDNINQKIKLSDDRVVMTESDIAELAQKTE